MKLTARGQLRAPQLTWVFDGLDSTQWKGMMKSSATSPNAESPSRLIDAKIKNLADWRGEALSRIRALIQAADPGVVEEWKWNVPVWFHDGLICTGETYKNVVKLTFAKGAQLRDPSGLFNSSLGGKVRRAIDVHEGEKLDEAAFKDLIWDAVALNTDQRRGSRAGRLPRKGSRRTSA